MSAATSPAAGRVYGVQRVCAAWAFPRSTRASPAMRSQSMGFFLCGIALEPFWPAAKYSSTSPISVCCRFLNSVANFSIEVPVIAMAVKNSAWRSR